MPFVLDASITLAWCFEDESSPYADYVLELLTADTALAPAIWPLEVANALCVAERRRRLLPADTVRFAELLSSLPIEVQGTTLERALGGIMQIARERSLSSYDAAYLDLAMLRGLSLATADERLATAASRLGVPLTGRQK